MLQGWGLMNGLSLQGLGLRACLTDPCSGFKVVGTVNGQNPA